MNYRTLIATAFAGAALLVAPVWAQEAEDEETTEEAAEEEEEEEEEVSDGGVEAVEEAQESAPAPASPKFKNAKKVLEDIMREKKWKNGTEKTKEGDLKRFFALDVASFDCKDPANEKKFFTSREMAAKRAILKAKAKIIEFVAVQMDAKDMLKTPGTDVHKELGAEAAKVNAAIEKQAAELAKLLAETDKAEAAELRGATVGQRLDDLFVAAIKKLDKEYDKDEHKKEAKARLSELKEKYDAASKEFEVLLKRAEGLKKQVIEKQESIVAKKAKLPLFGATVVMQTESWNGSQYQVAVLMCWSPALEESARGIVLGKEVKCTPSKLSVQDWLEKQDLATMVGPRQYIDEHGDRWYLGATARRYDDDMKSSLQERNQSLAELYASQLAVFSVFADVESQKAAAQARELRGDAEDEDSEDEEAIAETEAKALTQEFENRTIRGLQELASSETEHPITGQGILVKVYGINAADASAALAIEKRNIATLIEANRHETFERGRRAANEAAVKASKNRKEDFEAGAAEQTGRIQGELDSRKPKAKGGQRNVYETPAKPAKAGKKGKSTTGSFAGDTDVSDDF